LFYGRVEAYFAVYDSVVLTGPRSRGHTGNAGVAGTAQVMLSSAVR
jgi:hypothetical protein